MHSNYNERRILLSGLFFWILAFLTAFALKKEGGIMGLQ